jgi:anti-anti-sigma regulatory factor
LVELTDRCSSLLDLIGFSEKTVLSVFRPLPPRSNVKRDEEVTQPAIRVPRPAYETAKLPLIEITTEYSGDIVVMGVVYHPEGTRAVMDLANPVKALKGSTVRKLVMDFERATELGAAATDIIDYLREVYSHLKQLDGRFVLSSVSPSVDRLLRQDTVLQTLSIYGTEDSALQALRDPLSKRSLGAGAV